MPSASVWLVADDLTGAADASVPFVLHGFEATVLIDPRLADAGKAAGVAVDGAAAADSAMDAPVSRVHAVSTNSRGLPVDAAREAVRNGLRALCATSTSTATAAAAAASDRRGVAPRALRYKKIDSTLRGYVGMETAETFAAWACRRAVIAPAFPEMGRTLTDGRLAVDGVASATSVSDAFANSRFISLITASEPAVHGGVLHDLAEASQHQTGLAFVCDTTQSDTLDAIVDALWDLRDDTLWVGSAGLARALARRLARETPDLALALANPTQPATGVESFEPRPAGLGHGRVLFIGSMHPVTNRQCAEFETAGETSVVVTSAGQYDAVCALREGRDVLVRMRNDAPEALAAMVDAIAGAAPAGLIMSGGDSAVRVCEAAGVATLGLLGEVETGVPWGRCRGGAFDGVPVVLKSGGFGGPDTLLRAARFLAREDMKERS